MQYHIQNPFQAYDKQVEPCVGLGQDHLYKLDAVISHSLIMDKILIRFGCHYKLRIKRLGAGGLITYSKNIHQ